MPNASIQSNKMRLGYDRPNQAEGGADAQLAFDLNSSAAQLHDALGDG
jgi:hypothetical protein